MGMGSKHTWNFRVVHRNAPENDFVIAEVFYRGDSIEGWCPAVPTADSHEDLQAIIAQIIEGLMQPVIEESDIPTVGIPVTDVDPG